MTRSLMTRSKLTIYLHVALLVALQRAVIPI